MQHEQQKCDRATQVQHKWDMSITSATTVQHKCDTSNISAIQLQHECNTSATQVTPVLHECDTNNATAKRVKNFEFNNNTREKIHFIFIERIYNPWFCRFPSKKKKKKHHGWKLWRAINRKFKYLSTYILTFLAERFRKSQKVVPLKIASLKVVCYLQFLKNPKYVRIVLNHL